MKKNFYEYDNNIWIIVSILAFGAFSRIWISQFGFNHDFSAWKYNLELLTMEKVFMHLKNIIMPSLDPYSSFIRLYLYKFRKF